MTTTTTCASAIERDGARGVTVSDALPWLLERPAALNRGACTAPGVDPAWFFPDPFDAATARKAKAVCAECPVISDCLAFAVANDERGIWGGTEDRDRRGLQARPLVRRPRQPIQHGTSAGYQAHRRRGEKPCQACTDGHRHKIRAYREKAS